MFISCERHEELFGTAEKDCSNGDVTVSFLQSPKVNTQNPAYQRELVADLFWKQEVLRTVLINVFCGIPEIHIRVLEKAHGVYFFELIDGQQRVSAILGFLNEEYPFPKDFNVDGIDLSEMYADELKEKHFDIYQRITDYRISCKWYQNLTDEQTAWLFIKVLNNVATMAHQEMRNAILGIFSDYIRNTARFEKTRHELFTRTTEVIKGKKKTFLKYFSPTFKLEGRMEVDEWLSELIYLSENGVEKGVSHKSHFNWVEKMQGPKGDYSVTFTSEKKIKTLLDFGLTILKAVPTQRKSDLSKMVAMMMILYADRLRKLGQDIVPANYVKAFFKVFDDYSCDDKKLYLQEKNDNGSILKGFSDLFGGKNSNAIKTIFRILDKEKDGLKPTIDLEGKVTQSGALLGMTAKDFGIIKIDKRDFTHKQILKKWREQDYKCYYTGVILEENDIAGDHYIPRSAGIDNGGVTEYENLVVCSRYLNQKKSNMSAKSFENLVSKTKEELSSKVKEVA